MFNFQRYKCLLGFHGTMEVTDQAGYNVRLSHAVRERVIDPEKKTKVEEVVITAQRINHHFRTKVCNHCGAVDRLTFSVSDKKSSITVSMESWELHPDEGMFFWPTYDDPFALSPLGRKLRKK